MFEAIIQNVVNGMDAPRRMGPKYYQTFFGCMMWFIISSEKFCYSNFSDMKI